MDDENAHLIEFIPDPIETKTVELNFTQEAVQSSNENMQQDAEILYCKALAEVIKGYQEVILFGPAKTKSTLSNMLLGDDCFAEIKLDIQRTDKMESSEQHHFVKEYFSRHQVS